MDIDSKALNSIMQKVSQETNHYIQTQQAARAFIDGLWKIPHQFREASAYAASHDIATTYAEALRANLEDAGNSAMRIATTKNFVLLPRIMVSEMLGLMANVCARMAIVSQDVVETAVGDTRPLRSRWQSSGRDNRRTTPFGF